MVYELTLLNNRDILICSRDSELKLYGEYETIKSYQDFSPLIIVAVHREILVVLNEPGTLHIKPSCCPR